MFKIVCKYQGGRFESIDTASDLEEAKTMVQEYRIAFGSEIEVVYYKV